VGAIWRAEAAGKNMPNPIKNAAKDRQEFAWCQGPKFVMLPSNERTMSVAY
jgi:hypothetical protein